MILAKCNLNDESAKVFVKCHFPEIQKFIFKGNHFSDKFLPIMAEQKWNKLKEMNLSDVHSHWLGNITNKFTFLYPFINDKINKTKG